MGRTRRTKSDETEEQELSATAIVKLMEKNDTGFFHTSLREPFVTVRVRQHWETWNINGPEFANWTSELCFRTCGMVPTLNTISDVRRTLAGRALYDGPEERVFVRVASLGGAVYLDLANELWDAVEITNKGWKIVSEPPVKFLRKPGMLALPRPIRGGTIDDLRPLLNVDGDDQWKLAVGWLVGVLYPTGPFPILIVQGNHGSAKSTACKVLRNLIDPNKAPARGVPTNSRDLAISAKNSWCIVLDNLSSLKPWLSDDLCRLSTSNGFATRALYTDDDEKIFEGTRPVLLNGIDIGIDRGDLLDRAIMLSLSPISDEDRRTEEEFWALFNERRPSVLGALLDAVACALRRFQEIKPRELPRMADFAKWVCAAEPALNWNEGEFMEAYRSNQQEANAIALEASALAQIIVVIANRGPWEGTATELVEHLKGVQLSEIPADEVKPVPTTPKELSQELRRLAPNLIRIRVKVDFTKTSGDDSKRIIRISKSGDEDPENAVEPEISCDGATQ